MGMMPFLSGLEKTFDPGEVIVSKTDLTGHITYANRTFLRISEFTESEVLGKPHSIIRHPEMPRSIFKLLWDTLRSGTEIFAYVVNRTKHGHHYWVFAHVTPSLHDGAVVGYHSNRRTPDRHILDHTIIPLYRRLLDIEKAHDDPKAGLAASSAALQQTIADTGGDYGRFIFSL